MKVFLLGDRRPWFCLRGARLQMRHSRCCWWGRRRRWRLLHCISLLVVRRKNLLGLFYDHLLLVRTLMFLPELIVWSG